jgi:phosphate transport system substrate-binding protein
MKMLQDRAFASWRSRLLSLGSVLLLTACSQANSQEPQSIKIDGSSTVYPITAAIVEEYNAQAKSPAQASIDFSGTGGGFRKFCAGETDISNASRPIQQDEMEACRQAGIRYIELPVAFDALVVVVNAKNDWVESLTTEELKTIWEPSAEQKITRWQQIRADFPDAPLTLYGPGEDSGTFDYFTEAITGEASVSRRDYVASEDDTILVTGIAQDPNALGYFGLSYYEQNQNQLKALAIDSGKGAIIPSRQAVENAEYQPLARPLFIYVNAAAAQKNPTLEQFIKFYLDRAPEIVSDIGYIPLTEEAYHINWVTFHNGEVGTVFEGKSQFDVTLPELLRKRAEF